MPHTTAPIAIYPRTHYDKKKIRVNLGYSACGAGSKS